jgi:hypothetical protein
VSLLTSLWGMPVLSHTRGAARTANGDQAPGPHVIIPTATATTSMGTATTVEGRELRGLVRHCRQLVGQRAQAHNRLHGMLHRHQIVPPEGTLTFHRGHLCQVSVRSLGPAHCPPRRSAGV